MSPIEVRLRVNGADRGVQVAPDESLVDTLRERLGLTGTHQGCDTAQCGACTVLVEGAPVKSCNRLTAQTAGLEVLTVEALADMHGPLHPIQQAFSRHHALQCGFCTPGFVMRTLAMGHESVPAEPASVREALAGNLCRCTGYEGIVAAICEVLPVLRQAPSISTVPRPGAGAVDPMARAVSAATPAEAARAPAYLRVSTLEEACRVLGEHPEARPLAGGQSLLPTLRLGLAAPSHLIDLQGIAGLQTIEIDAERLLIGAMVPHARVAGDPRVRERWPMLAALARGIADEQVRSVGTLGGAIANNDPAACWPAGVLASAASIHTTRRRIAADDFFNGLFTTALEPGELITGVAFPRAIAGCYLKFEQPASRFALLGVALVKFADHVRVAITGLGGGVMRWSQAESRLGGRFDPAALDGLLLDPALASADLHAPAEYRAHLAGVLLRRAVKRLQGAGR